MTINEVELDGETFSPEELEAVARNSATVSIKDSARSDLRASRQRVEDVLKTDEAVYGITTGFGELVEERIPPDKIETLQRNLLRSHAAGVGRELTREEVRAMLVTRVNALVKGYSGIRESVVDLLVAMLNEGVHPVVPSRGSLGASGDLAPLAHAMLVLIGEGRAKVDGEVFSGKVALNKVGLKPTTLAAKEGLALINGTQLTTGLAALAVRDAERTVQAADAAGALTIEVTMSSNVPCHPLVGEVRPHPGQATSARNIRRLTADSGIVTSHRNCNRVQDAYSLRCLPQVHGSVREAISHLREAVEIELNSATDNPLVFDIEVAPQSASGGGSGAIISAGNFHGEQLALRLDYATNALTELAAIAERRIDRLLNPNIQETHLPPFLTERGGLHSGYMIVQYTAAALLNECRSTGSPVTDSTTVSGNQEDHVSMSATSALSFQNVLSMVQTVIAIELLCATQAAEFVTPETVEDAKDVDGPLKHGQGTKIVFNTIREVVPKLEEDRAVYNEIDCVRELVKSGLLVDQLAERINLE